MNAIGRLLLVAVLMVLLDLPWLTFINGQYTAVIQTIQGGRNVRMRPLAGIIVYPALAYLALRTSSLKDAFLTGAAVYAVYDFTVLAVFKDYPFYLAIGDTLWGAILFSAIFFLREKFKL
jgi:uncharacterized membrane protein